MAAKRAKERSKSKERARSKSAETRRPRVRTETLKTPAGVTAPTSRSSRSSVPNTPDKEKRTKAMLEAQAAELEEMLANHMDPSSISTPGSKATKAYWIARVADLEHEWKLCNTRPEDMELDKLSSDGEEDSEVKIVGEQDLAKPENFDLEALQKSEPRENPRSSRRAWTPAPTRPRSEAPPTATATRARSGGGKVKALTDHAAPFPSLSNKFSDDVVINLALSLQGQLFAFKWKLFTWMLRVKRAIRMECGPKARWKADASIRATSGSTVGPPGVGPPTMQRPEACPPDARASLRTRHPSRGLTQKLRRGAAQGNKSLGLLTLVATWQAKWSMMELYPTGLEWENAQHELGWRKHGPLWREEAPPTWKQCRAMRERVEDARPDVLILNPPAGPWSPWTSATSTTAAQRRERKQRYWPLWYLIGELWTEQCRNHRLVVLVMPGKMRPPDPDEMRELHTEFFAKGARGHDPGLYDGDQLRDPRFEAKVDLCQWGAEDPTTGRPFKKTCRVEVNDPWLCAQLTAGGVCRHAPGAHQEVCGHVRGSNGELVSRLVLAQHWPEPWGNHVLATATETLLSRRAPTASVALHQECPREVEWETVPVEVERSPEGILRQRLGEASGYQYDYIYFEGASASLTKPLRNTLAKLHVALGHISQEKLKRMLHLQGAKPHIIHRGRGGFEVPGLPSCYSSSSRS